MIWKKGLFRHKTTNISIPCVWIQLRTHKHKKVKLQPIRILEQQLLKEATPSQTMNHVNNQNIQRPRVIDRPNDTPTFRTTSEPMEETTQQNVPAIDQVFITPRDKSSLNNKANSAKETNSVVKIDLSIQVTSTAQQ